MYALLCSPAKKKYYTAKYIENISHFTQNAYKNMNIFNSVSCFSFTVPCCCIQQNITVIFTIRSLTLILTALTAGKFFVHRIAQIIVYRKVFCHESFNSLINKLAARGIIFTTGVESISGLHRQRE